MDEVLPGMPPPPDPPDVDVLGVARELLLLEAGQKPLLARIKALRAELTMAMRKEAEKGLIPSWTVPGAGKVSLVCPDPVWTIVHEAEFTAYVADELDGAEQGWLVTRVDPIAAEKLIRAATEDGEKLPGVELVERLPYVRVSPVRS